MADASGPGPAVKRGAAREASLRPAGPYSGVSGHRVRAGRDLGPPWYHRRVKAGRAMSIRPPLPITPPPSRHALRGTFALRPEWARAGPCPSSRGGGRRAPSDWTAARGVASGRGAPLCFNSSPAVRLQAPEGRAPRHGAPPAAGDQHSRLAGPRRLGRPASGAASSGVRFRAAGGGGRRRRQTPTRRSCTPRAAKRPAAGSSLRGERWRERRREERGRKEEKRGQRDGREEARGSEGK